MTKFPNDQIAHHIPHPPLLPPHCVFPNQAGRERDGCFQLDAVGFPLNIPIMIEILQPHLKKYICVGNTPPARYIKIPVSGGSNL